MHFAWPTDALYRDIRYGLRMLSRVPGFTAVAILTLALGIGANTAIFSVIYGVLLRPLPYQQATNIVYLRWNNGEDFVDGFTVQEFQFWRQHSSVFRALAGFQGPSDLELQRGQNETEWLKALQITNGFLSTLGVTPNIGRGMLPEDTEAGGSRSAILTDHLWRNTFNSEPTIIGRQIVLNGQNYTIVGILPPSFTFTQPVDVFIPLPLGKTIADTGNNIEVFGRLKAGTSLLNAQADMSLVAAQFQPQTPAHRLSVEIITYQDWLTHTFRLRLLILIAASSLLLLIACANVTALLLARATSRHKEISVRLALGASRAGIFRQFLIEGLLIGLTGGAAGLGGAIWGVKGLMSAIPWNLPLFDQVRLDGHVLAFAFFAGLIASLTFGVTSFFQTSKLDFNDTLKEGRTIAGVGHKRSRLLDMVVVSEIALSLVLVLSAGLLIQTLYNFQEQKLGFDPRNVISMETPFSSELTSSTSRIWNFERRVLERIQAIPGVQSVAVASILPLSGTSNLPAQRAGHPSDSTAATEYRAISPEYFQTMHISISRGRSFLESDTESSPPVAVISQTLARSWWHGKNPIGDRLIVGEFHGRQIPQILEPAREIVGVVADVKGSALNSPPPPIVYVPASQVGSGVVQMIDSTAWVVRTKTGDASVLVKPLRDAIAQVAVDQSVLNIQPMTQLIETSVAFPKFNGMFMTMFAALALLLTLVGVYGVLNFQVGQRTHEMGIRIALGAQRADIMRAVLGEAAKLALIGIGIGLAAAFGLTRIMANLLFGVKPTDLAIFVGAGAILFAAALFAAYLPARRAMRVDPIVALRYE